MVIYEPDDDFNGVDSFGFKTFDGQYNSDMAIVSLTINPINDAPVTSDATFSTVEEVEIIINLITLTTDVDNDIKRYQYWQSETDKARNEIAALKENLNTVQSQQAQQPQVTEKEESAMEQFPPPPEKPKKPSSFNRSDAYEDSSITGLRKKIISYKNTNNSVNNL